VSKTVFDAIVESLRESAAFNSNDTSKPAAILWTDKDSQWMSLSDKLRTAIPEFLTFGSYEADKKTGPGIWIRCMVARALGEVDWNEDQVPIIYMPGVSRQELRAVEDCPEHLKSVVEIQYRGVFWTQKNARDWTICAFLQSKDGGLELDVAHDNNTKEAMKKALVKLAETPISRLQGRRLEADDFYALIQPDPVRDILLWMNDPKGMKSLWGKTSFDAFVNRCREKYGLHPVKDGELVAAEKMGLRGGNWSVVWDRFAEAPQNYPNIPDLLRRAKPDMFSSESSWPQNNDAQEGTLRNELLSCAELNPAEAAKKVILLESNHRHRRNWVWAKLGQAPLSFAIQHLNELALLTSTPLPSSSLEAMIEAYVETGYKVDLAALQAMASCSESEPRDFSAVICAVRSLYQSYLDEHARIFQKLIQGKDIETVGPQVDVGGSDGECVVFADGLRFDIAQSLSTQLREHGMQVNMNWGLSPVPTVTATAKPAISPVRSQLSDESISEDFAPSIKAEDRILSRDLFKKMLTNNGYEFLGGQETGDPTKKAWTEIGEIDSYGHKYGIKLAHHVMAELRSIRHRVSSLLKAGYRTVNVITDHGWLLLPGDLPKVDLPHYLVKTRWNRCAKLKENVASDFPSMPWHFNKSIHVISPHGIDTFYAGTEYAHGGLSLQECVIPILAVQAGKTSLHIEIENVKWSGLRCRIEVVGEFAGCKAGVRTKPADASTSLTGEKSISNDGTVSLLVEDDEMIDQPAALVIMDSNDTLVIKKPVIIGER